MQTSSGKIVFASKNERNTARRERALDRQDIRESRTDQEQIVHVLARGGKEDCKEIRRLKERING